MSEIKPCPFCGAADEMVAVVREGSYISVVCIECDARGPDKKTVGDAIAAWNRRDGGSDGGS